MVQLKDEPISHVTGRVSRDVTQPSWPYVLFSLGLGLIAAGAYQIHAARSPGLCPFHALFGGGSSSGPALAVQDGPFHEGGISYGEKGSLPEGYVGRVVTKEELARHGPGSPDPWLSVLGQVYDVSKGMKHYGEGGTYAFFTGRDGSRAYSTGDFSESGLSDEVGDLSVEQIGEVYHWINIFSKKYTFVGRLQGAFFTGTGAPTAEWRAVEQSLKSLGAQEERKRELKRRYPACNSHYNQATSSGEVWCTEKSGGVTRAWVGVPRRLHIPGERVRCACVPETMTEDGKLKPYPDCPETATSCRFRTD